MKNALLPNLFLKEEITSQLLNKYIAKYIYKI